MDTWGSERRIRLSSQTGHSGRPFNSTSSMAERKKRSGGRRANRRSRGKSRGVMVFERTNYLLLILGVALVVVGYVIMRMENEVDGFISLYVAPLMILGGYLEIIWAIMWRPKEEAETA